VAKISSMSSSRPHITSPPLDGRVCVLTGGRGFLGQIFSRALLDAGAKVAILDVAPVVTEPMTDILQLSADITDEISLRSAQDQILEQWGQINVLINNAALNPNMDGTDTALDRLENFPLERWNLEVGVGLTGSFLCGKVFGSWMAENGGGVIVNIASDFSVLAPDQRIYLKPKTSPNQQPVKPVTYSAVKTGLIGLTRYFATYWAEQNIRANALSPGGVFNEQPAELVKNISERTPLGRMALPNEFGDALVFLCSDQSSYMTGQNMVIDGGRSIW